MTDAVLAALNSLADDGTLAAIFEKYGVIDMMIATPVVNMPLSEPLA
jgi:ABC-type amino acid transport substrate-binding protein